MVATTTTEDDYFLWLSDIHFDPYYATSQAFKSPYYEDANCDDMNDAPSLGSYGCDAPISLVRNALEYAVNITSSAEASSPYATPKFVLISGDSIRHGVDLLFNDGNGFNEGAEGRNEDGVEETAHASWHKQAMDKAGEILHELVSMVEVAFPESKVIVSLGNNDVVPDYYLELLEDDNNIENNALTPETAGMLGVLYNALSMDDSIAANINSTTLPGLILTANDQSSFLRGGYYSRTLHNGALTILSLNTVLYSGIFQPTPPTKNGVEDPGKQFSWMKEMLSKCRDSGTQAMIVGHIPPTVGSFRHTQLWKDIYIQTYYEIVKEFDEVITAQLFGHLHTDEFRVGLADEGSASMTNISLIPSMTTPILLGPSITPLHGNDPSIRLVKYGSRSDTDNPQYKLLDCDSHSFSMGVENQWSKLYTFSEAYSIASNQIKENGLSSEVFRTIVQSMEDEGGKESPLLESYRFYKQSGAAGNECDSQCRDELLCIFQSATSSGYENCLLQRSHSWTMSPTPGRNILGIFTSAIFFIVALSFGIVRYSRRRKRRSYHAAPSVGGDDVQKEGVEETGAKDQEMI